MECVNKKLFDFDVIPNEEWSFIPSIKHKYIVSTFGRVASFISKSYKLLSLTSRGGYLAVRFSDKGCQKTFYVHRLVGKTFIPNPKMLPCINHKDENKNNPSVDNLEWCTQQYNLRYSGITTKWREHNAEMAKKLESLNPMENFKGKDVVARFSRFKRNHKTSSVYSYDKNGKVLIYNSFKDLADSLETNVDYVIRVCFLNYYLNSLRFSICDKYPTTIKPSLNRLFH
jgi:hypothetical protein